MKIVKWGLWLVLIVAVSAWFVQRQHSAAPAATPANSTAAQSDHIEVAAGVFGDVRADAERAQ